MYRKIHLTYIIKDHLKVFKNLKVTKMTNINSKDDLDFFLFKNIDVADRNCAGLYSQMRKNDRQADLNMQK